MVLGAIFPKIFPDFPRWKHSHSLLADSFLTIQTSLKRQKPLTCRRSLLWILFLENNLKSKERDGHSRGRNPPPPLWIGGMTEWSPTVLDGCPISFIPPPQKNKVGS
jgi:hypothetical protein